MKFSAFFLAMTLIVSAQAKELVCWDKYGKRGDSPLMRAHIVSDSELQNITFNPSTSTWTSSELALPSKVKYAKAKLITSKRSPYIGHHNFTVAGGRIILPTKLNAKTLSQVVQTGLHKAGEKGVNGVVITSWKEMDGGNHKSFRLVCRIYGEYSAY